MSHALEENRLKLRYFKILLISKYWYKVVDIGVANVWECQLIH